MRLLKQKSGELGFAIVSIFGVVALWWGLSAGGLMNPVLLPSPVDVAEAFWAAASDGSLLTHIYASMRRVLQGFLLGFIVAVPVGAFMSHSRLSTLLLDPIIEFLRPIPPIAVIPLAILWFGIGDFSKVFIIAYGAFFPILVNTLSGFSSVDKVLIRAAKTLGANQWHVFRDVILRSALTHIIVGARLGVGMAFIVLVAAELIASSEGLGFMINDARYNFRTDRVFVGIIVIGFLGLFLNKTLLFAEKRLLRWQEA